MMIRLHTEPHCYPHHPVHHAMLDSDLLGHLQYQKQLEVPRRVILKQASLYLPAPRQLQTNRPQFRLRHYLHSPFLRHRIQTNHAVYDKQQQHRQLWPSQHILLPLVAQREPRFRSPLCSQAQAKLLLSLPTVTTLRHVSLPLMRSALL